MNRIHAELSYWRAVLIEWGYVVRPYDMIADRRRWRWQHSEPCGYGKPMPDEFQPYLDAAMKRPEFRAAYEAAEKELAGPVPCPEGFSWIGQSFRSCDMCGLPAWEHAGNAVLPPGVGPFSTDAWVLSPYKPGEADAIRAKWARCTCLPDISEPNPYCERHAPAEPAAPEHVTESDDDDDDDGGN